MENKKRTAFETKVMTVLSIVTVLVFVLYILGFILLNNYITFSRISKNDVEVLRIVKKEAPDTYTVFVRFVSEGQEVQANFNIKEGEITVVQ